MLSPNSKGFLKIFTVHDTSIEPKQEATSVLSDLKGYFDIFKAVFLRSSKRARDRPKSNKQPCLRKDSKTT